MDNAEYNPIVTYLRHAEQSKYRYAEIKARFEAEPAAVYGTNMARWIPDFAYTHQLLLESIALHLPPNGSGLEQGIVGTYQEDSPLSVRQHMEMLAAVGFGAADVSTNAISSRSMRGANTTDAEYR